MKLLCGYFICVYNFMHDSHHTYTALSFYISNIRSHTKISLEAFFDLINYLNVTECLCIDVYAISMYFLMIIVQMYRVNVREKERGL